MRNVQVTLIVVASGTFRLHVAEIYLTLSECK